MLNGLLGKKIGMTQVYGEDGIVQPVTVLEAGPCVVTGVRTKDDHGYNAVQLGYVQRKTADKPAMGLFNALKVKPLRFLREFRVADKVEVKAGETVGASLFEDAKRVDVRGLSKGRGFAGMVKRFHKKRGPAGHGSMNVRAPGSIGCNTTPARVIKGKRMPGHMGYDEVTSKNLKVIKVDAAKNLLFVRGSIPGPNGGIVEIRKSLKQK